MRAGSRHGHEGEGATGSLDGVGEVLDEEGKDAFRPRHGRAGDLVASSKPDAWFTYHYWLEDRRAPDFARTVDIHRKPGYDPSELFLDPDARLAKARAALALRRKADWGSAIAWTWSLSTPRM